MLPLYMSLTMCFNFRVTGNGSASRGPVSKTNDIKTLLLTERGPDSDQVITISLVKCEHFQSQTETLGQA